MFQMGWFNHIVAASQWIILFTVCSYSIISQLPSLILSYITKGTDPLTKGTGIYDSSQKLPLGGGNGLC